VLPYFSDSSNLTRFTVEPAEITSTIASLNCAAREQRRTCTVHANLVIELIAVTVDQTKSQNLTTLLRLPRFNLFLV